MSGLVKVWMSKIIFYHLEFLNFGKIRNFDHYGFQNTYVLIWLNFSKIVLRGFVNSLSKFDEGKFCLRDISFYSHYGKKNWMSTDHGRVM